MGKLWQKGSESLDKEIEQFEVGDDNILNLKLAPFDVYGSMAHAIMLNKIGIISQEESDAILAGLKEILGTSKRMNLRYRWKMKMCIPKWKIF